MHMVLHNSTTVCVYLGEGVRESDREKRNRKIRWENAAAVVVVAAAAAVFRLLFAFV